MAKIRTSKATKGLNRFESQDLPAVEQTIRDNRQDYTFSDKEMEELGKSIQADLELQASLEEFEREERKKKEAEKANKEIQAELTKGGAIQALGNFWDGLTTGNDASKYYMMQNGKYLRRKDNTNFFEDVSNVATNMFTNPLAGINEEDGTYNEDWEEVSPEEVSKFVQTQAAKRHHSNAFHSGFAIASFFNGAYKMATRDSVTGVASIFNNDLSTTAKQVQSTALGINAKLNTIEMQALEKVGLKNTSYYKYLEQGNKDIYKGVANISNSIKEEQKKRAKDIAENGESALTQVVNYITQLEDNNKYSAQQEQIRQLISQTAVSLSGEEKPEFLNEDQAGVIDPTVINFNGNDIPMEYTEGSKWDAKRLVLDNSGQPMLDDQGNPVYEDKYSLMDKLSKASIGNLFTKYGSEDLINAASSSVGFLAGGYTSSTLTRGIGSTIGKGVSYAGKVGNISERGLRMLETVTNKLDDLMPSLSKQGGSMAVANRAANSFNKAFQTTLNSYVMTNAESQQIGEQTAKEVYEKKIDKLANIDRDQLYQDILQENPGLNETEAQLKLEATVSSIRSEFAKNNPDTNSDAIALSLAAKETASSLNNMNTLFNLNFGAAFAKGRSLSRNILSSPYSGRSIASGIYHTLGEGVQEYFEEGLFNSYAQKAATEFAEGKNLSILDFVDNDFITKENVTSGLIGMISGLGQSTLMSGFGSFSKYNEYRKQQKNIQEFKSLAESKPEDLKSVLELALDAKDFTEFKIQQDAYGAEIEKLEREGKKEEAEKKKEELKGLTENLLVNKAIRAAHMGTSQKLSDALTELSKNEEFTEDQRKNFAEAVELNEMIADMHDKYLYYNGSSTIMQNRVNKFMVNKNLKDFQTKYGATVASQYDNVLDLETSRQMASSGLTVEDAEYSPAFDQLRSRIKIDPATNKAVENKILYDNRITEVNELLNKLDEQYYELTSRKGQQELANKKREALKKAVVDSTTTENVQEVKETIKKEEGKLTAETVDEIENKAYTKQVQVPSPNINTGFNKNNATVIDETTPTPKAVEVKAEEIPVENVVNSSEDLDYYMNIMNSAGAVPTDQELSDDNDESSVTRFAPVITYNKDDESQNQMINSLAEAFKKDLALNPTLPLDGVIARFAMDKGFFKVGQYFDLIVESWGKATGKPLTSVEKKSLYNQYFGVDNALGVFGELTNTPTVVGNTQTNANVVPETVPSPETETTQTPVIESQSTPELAEGINVNTNPQEDQEVNPVKAVRGLLNAESDAKLAFLGLQYNVSPDGQTYTTSTTTINESAKVFLDPRNFNPGDTFDISFNFNYLLNPSNTVRVWIENSIGEYEGKLLTVEERIKQIFPDMSFTEFARRLQTDPRSLLENDTFLKMVPVGIIFENELLEGGLNDYDWWNARNIAETIDPKTRELIPYSQNKIILDGRKKNLEIRQSLLNSENFTSNIEITANTSAFYNKLLLVTEKEISQGYSDEYQSVLDAFNNDLDYFEKNVALGFFNNGNIFTEKKNGNKVLMIGSKQVSPEQIENLVAIKDAILKEAEANGQVAYNPDSGRRVMLAKSGYENGKPIYTAHLVTTNHSAKQEEFKKINSLLNRLVATNPIQSDSKYLPSYAWVLQNLGNAEALAEYPAITAEYIETAKAVKKIFLDKFKIDLTKNSHISDGFRNFYPTRNPNKKEEFTQNINSFARPMHKNGIPDLTALFEGNGTITEALNKIVSGNIDFITPQQLYAKNSHTQYIFTPFDKDGDIIYSNLAQKKISFRLTGSATNDNVENVLNKKLEDAKNQLEFLKEGLEKRPNDETLKESLEIVQEQVKNLEVKVEEEKKSEEVIPSTEEVVRNTSEGITTQEFTESDINDINNEVFFKALSKIDINNFSKASILEQATIVFEETVRDLKSNGLEAEANFMVANKNNILGIGTYDGSVKEVIDVTFDLPIETEFAEEEQGTVNLTSENSKDYTKESFERDIKTSLGMKVKAILSGITDTRFTDTTFANFRQTLPLNETLDFLQQALAESENNTLEALGKTIKRKIEKNPKDFGFYQEIFDRLNNKELIDSGVINEILYNLYQAKLDMNMLFYSINSDGQFTAKNYDANSKSPLIVKRNKWKENLKMSSLINRYEEGYYTVNKDEANRLLNLRDEINRTAKEGIVNTRALEDFLNGFGISLNEMTIDSLLQQNLPEVVGGNLTTDGFILREKGLVSILAKNIEEALKHQENKKKLALSSEYVSGEKTILFDLLTNDNSSNLNSMIAYDNLLSAISMTSIYVGGKIVNSYTAPNQISNTVKRLKNNPEIPYGKDSKLKSYFNILEQTPMTQDSLILEMIKNEPRFKSYFDVVNVSLEALKERGTKSRTDREITSLSDKDEFITMFNLFSHIDGEITNDDYSDRFGRLKFRRGTIGFPALSDSSQKPLLKTALVNLRAEDFTDGTITRLSDNVLDFVKTHLVTPNLKRIEQYIKSGKNVNVFGHNVGAMFMTDMPSLNFIGLTINLDSSGNLNETGEPTVLPAIEVFKLYISQGKTIEDFLEDYNTEINNEVHRNLDFEVNQYIDEKGETGLLVEEGIYDGQNINFIDQAYINSPDRKTSSNLNKARLMMYDYVINYMVNQKEIQVLFAGDIANFFKDKHQSNFSDYKNSFPISTEDIINHYYNTPGQKERINSLISSGATSLIASKFPLLRGSSELFPELNPNERLAINLPLQQVKFNTLMKDVQNNLSKRLKALLSPGQQFPDSTGNKKYLQVMVQDVESASEVLIPMAVLKYPELAEDNDFKIKVLEFKEIDDILEVQRTPEQQKRYKELLKEFNTKYPLIAPFFKNATTDAQEYTTWKENLNQLRSQGRITQEDYDTYYSKFTDQTKNGVTSENELSLEDMQKLVMQPTKPLQTGLYYEENNGYHYQRLVYVKSSSFPLIPQLTRSFPKLDTLRKNLESLETDDRTVRMSYASANKVGAPIGEGISLAALYKEDGLTEEDKDLILNTSSLELDRSNFYIQQDKPFKSDKNAKAGKIDKVNRATQFEKIILGDGISKIKEQIFPSRFSKEILDSLNITPKDGKVSGVELQKIYNELYKREQKLLKNNLYRQLGIERTGDMMSGNPKSMRKLVSLLNKRLNNKQDRQALELVYYGRDSQGNTTKGTQKSLIESGHSDIFKAEFKIPLYMTPNSKKFESVLNSVVNKALVNLKLPGFSSPVASQQGFDIKGFDAETTYPGLITTPNFNPKKGLQATVDSATGELKHAQVFAASKYKVLNETTGEYEYIDLKNFTDENNVLDTNKLPQELLELFSFRIPTSAHQSGVVIEIVGFLPHTVGDMLVVPKDHTTQIGEDYDIDVRYMYQLNYTQDENGNLKAIDYDDFTLPKSVEEIRNEYNAFRDQLFNEFFTINTTNGVSNTKAYLNNPYWRNNQEILWEMYFIQDTLEARNLTQDMLSGINRIFNVQFSEDLLETEDEINTTDALRERLAELEAQLIPTEIVKEKGRQMREEFKDVKKDLYQAFKIEEREAKRLMNDYALAIKKEEHDLKVVENNIVNMYKSVFSSSDRRVRDLVSRVLSTDFSDNTATEMDNVLSSAKDNSVYNVYSPSSQRSIMKLGADGKMGIGVHSNAVTMNSILQQYNSEENGELRFYSIDPEGNAYYYDIVLGNLIFDGVLGKIEKNGKRISETVMESQNSATDNQKLQIMGRRNENKHTINVLAILQATGNDFDGFILDGNEMSYASLFINQPIIRDYVKLMNKYGSSTSKFKGDINEQVDKDLFEKWGKHLPKTYWSLTKEGKNTRRLNVEAVYEIAPRITGENLYDSLLEEEAFKADNAANQWYAYQSFLQLKGLASHYNRLQRFVNIENGGLGVSYFDTIELMKELITLVNPLSDEVRIENSNKLFGDYVRIEPIAEVLTLDENTNEILSAMQVEEDIFGNLIDENGKIVEENTSTRKVVTPRSIEEFNKKIQQYESMGYIKVQLSNSNTAHMVSPQNHYAHKIINSITTGYELWNSIFPYDHTFVNQIINDIQNSAKRLTNDESLDLKYRVISELKDYIYSNSLDLFEGNVEKYRKDLFFDYNNDGVENESLATYLLNLSNNPNFKNRLFKQNFFKDLVFDINKDTYPSTIRYNTSDVSKGYNLSVYNIFEKLIDSKTELPDYNGKPYTYELLMKDILRYSLLADQGNGAIGFRHLLPMSLLDKYGVSDSVKLQTDIKNQNIQNIVFNGIEKAVSNFFGSELTNAEDVVKNYNLKSFDKVSAFVKMVNKKIANEYGITNAISILNELGDVKINIIPDRTVKSTFVRQFFQHNPDYANTIGTIYRGNMMPSATKKLKNILEDNGYTPSLDITKVNSLHIKHEYDIFDDFITISDLSGKRILFERVNEDGLYIPIPTLGVFGYNEYSVGKYLDRSNVNKNNVTRTVDGKINNSKTLDYIENTTLSEIVKDIYNSSGPYQEAFKFLSPYVDLKNQKIKVVDANGTAFYQNGTIFINRNWLENEDITKKELQEKILEELVHRITEETIDTYVDITGFDENGQLIIENKLSDIPNDLKDLLDVYQKAIDYVINKYGLEEFLSSVRKNDGHIINIDNNNPDETFAKGLAMYRASNIHEFIAGMFLRDEVFAREMDTVEYGKTSDTILERFASRLVRLLNSVVNVFKNNNSINKATITSFYSFLTRNYEEIDNTEFNPEMPTPALIQGQQFLQDNLPTIEPDGLSASELSALQQFQEDTSGDQVEELPSNIKSLVEVSSEETTPQVETAKIVKSDVREVALSFNEEFSAYDTYKAQTVKIPGYKAWFGVIKLSNGNVALVTDVFPSNQGGDVVLLNNNLQPDAQGLYGIEIKRIVDEMVSNSKNAENIRKLVEGNDNLSNFENITKC